jgi:PilZ domain
MAERRRFKRVYARLKVWCEGEDFTLLAQSANVSAGGLFVQASSMPPHRARVRVTIQELGAVADAEARWSCGAADDHRGGFGLHILAFERGAEAYGDYVERLSSRSGEHRLNWPADSGPEEP